jgi:hypothetical protein
MSLSSIIERDDYGSNVELYLVFPRKNPDAPNFQKEMIASVEDYKMPPIPYPIAPN